jgi:hypothetical protein
MTDALGQQFAATANPLDDSDWEAIRSAARPRRRRVVLLAAAALVAAVAAVPALGLAGRLSDLVQGSPAPPTITTYFASSNALRRQLLAETPAAGQDLHARYTPVIADQAKGIAAIDSPDGPIFLWAAPTEAGGQCWLIQAGGDASSGRPYGYGSCDDLDSSRPLGTDAYWTAERPSVLILHARVRDDSIARVEVDFAGGGSVSLPVVSGHVLGTVSKDEHVVTWIGRDADGNEVARESVAD